MTMLEDHARSVFLAALERTPDQWPAFLAEVCGGSAALRARVEQLLHAHLAMGTIHRGRVGGLVTTTCSPLTEGPGTVIGVYKLLELIGEGGFGVVFMAEQTQPVRRKVALKILKPGMDTRPVVARFEAERQALAIMDHPNIAKVLDGGATSSGRPYFVMELVRGVPITEFCDRNHLTPRQRLELFVTVCQAMQHAHQKGIIHRDLKPSNVMVTVHDTTPVAKVIDFGVAKALGQVLTDKTLFTGFAQMIGTPLYMSPEQAGQSGLDIDTRSDIYTLGVLLYELLTGTTPFDEKRFKQATYDEIRRIICEEEPSKPSTRLLQSRETLASIAAQRQTEPAKLTKLVRGELDWIVMKSLEKDRNRRYASAIDFAMDVQRYLSDEPVQACPPSALYRFKKFARRYRVVLSAASAVVLAMVLGTIISVWQAVRATTAEGLAEQRATAEKGERERAVQAERQARDRLFEARLAQARASRLTRQAGQRFESWKALTEAAQLAREMELGEDRLRELRDEAIACLALADVQLAKQWEGLPRESSSGFGFDANLERYARSDEKGNISVRRVDNDQQLAALPGGGIGAVTISFSPDGTLLAVQSWQLLPGQPTNFQLWDWQRKQCVFEPSFPVESLNFSPDGRYLALGQSTKALILYDVVTRNEKRMSLDFSPSYVAFHPDGSKLAVAGSGGEIQVRDVGTGNLLRKLPGRSLVWQLAWHPDGVLLAAGYDDSNLSIWDTTTGQEHALLRGHQAGVVRVAFSPDGDTLLSSAWDGSSRLWDPWTGREMVRFAGEARHFSRDGQRLAGLAGSKLAVWDVAAGREYRSLPKSQPTAKESINGGDISPDGRWLVITGGDRVRLVDLVLRKEIVSLPGRFAVDAKFHPNGKELFTSGRVGLYRWPLHAEAGSLRIGPARRLPTSGWLERISLDREGRTLAVVHSGINGGGRVLELDNPPGNEPTFDHGDAVTVALSPNGRWVASGTQHDFGVKVSDAHSGQFVCHLIPNERDTTVAFSPDSQSLVVGLKSEYQILDTSSWKLTHRIPRDGGGHFGQMTFTRDGKVLALLMAPGRVQLVNPANGRPFAALQMPNTDPIEWLSFTPDGGQLLAGAGMLGHVHVWDLRLVGRQLQDLGLNWELPLTAPTPPGDTKPLKVEVDRGELVPGMRAHEHFMRGEAHFRAKRWSEAVAACSKAIEFLPEYSCALHMRGLASSELGKWDEAIADLSKAVSLAKSDPRLFNNLAWMLLTCPEARMRDATRALPLAQKAVQLAPQNGVYWNTLGVAHYRAGNLQTVSEALQKSMTLRKGGDSFDFFFLAMAHWRLNQQEQARHWYTRAVEWMDKNLPNDEELRRFRAEAAELLGMKEPK